jgi:hypothetical protein
MRKLDDIFDRLQRSAFRQSFKLTPAELGHLHGKGFPVVLAHAQYFLWRSV